MANFGVLASTVLIIGFHTNFATLPSKICKGVPPDIPDFYFDNLPPCIGIFPAQCIEEIQPVTFKYYTKDDRVNWQELSRNKIPPKFNPDVPTKFLVHGWRSSNDSYLVNLTNTILDKHGDGVVLVNWEGGSDSLNFFQSSANTRTIGKEISILMTILQRAYPSTILKFWCIGHSLGGQVCGHAGNYKPLDVLFALDPAGPDFETKPPQCRLNPDSAAFVSVVHTAGTGKTVLKMGMSQPCGDVDIYVNGGGDQPQCPSIGSDLLSKINGTALLENALKITPLLPEFVYPSCSHMSAVYYFLEAMMYDNCVSRQKCSDYQNLPGSCSDFSGPVQAIGGYSPGYLPVGIFYLKTNKIPLYCIG